jgi:hypothetical protein
MGYSILRPTHLMETWARVLGEPLVNRSKALVLGSGHNPVSWVALDDIARAAAVLVNRRAGGCSLDLGGPQALTITQVNELLADCLHVTVKGHNRMPSHMLRIASRLIHPVKEVAGRQMLLGALLDTQPQVVESAATWRQLQITPISFRQWLEDNAAALTAQWKGNHVSQ